MTGLNFSERYHGTADRVEGQLRVWDQQRLADLALFGADEGPVALHIPIPRPTGSEHMMPVEQVCQSWDAKRIVAENSLR